MHKAGSGDLKKQAQKLTPGPEEAAARGTGVRAESEKVLGEEES